MRRIVHLTTFVLAWGFAIALICTIIREAKGDAFFVPEGYLSGYLAYALIFGFLSYKTRSPTINSSEPPDDQKSDSN
jgi:hypothetical protein